MSDICNCKICGGPPEVAGDFINCDNYDCERFDEWLSLDEWSADVDRDALLPCPFCGCIQTENKLNHKSDCFISYMYEHVKNKIPMASIPNDVWNKRECE